MAFPLYWCVNYQCSCRLVKGIILCSSAKKHKLYCIYRFSNTKLIPFQTLSLGFSLKIFLKFPKFVQEFVPRKLLAHAMAINKSPSFKKIF